MANNKTILIVSSCIFLTKFYIYHSTRDMIQKMITSSVSVVNVQNINNLFINIKIYMHNILNTCTGIYRFGATGR